MASPTAVAHTFTEEQLGELLELMADADSVELKLTVRKPPGFSAEVDAMPGGYVCSARVT